MTPLLSCLTLFGSSKLKSAVIAVVVGLWTCEAHAADITWVELVHNGQISDRWETKGNWHAGKDDVVSLTPRPGEKGWNRFDSYLWSKDEYEDFEIQFDYRVQPQGNSGFYFHVGDRSDPVKKGIEVQIFDSSGKPDRAKLSDHDSGGIIPGIPPTKSTARPAGEWYHFRILVERRRLKVLLNDQLVNDIDLEQKLSDRPNRGYIGFQDHGLPLALRNVRIRKR
jgi:hypothetical protein